MTTVVLARIYDKIIAIHDSLVVYESAGLVTFASDKISKVGYGLLGGSGSMTAMGQIRNKIKANKNSFVYSHRSAYASDECLKNAVQSEITNYLKEGDILIGETSFVYMDKYKNINFNIQANGEVEVYMAERQLSEMTGLLITGSGADIFRKYMRICWNEYPFKEAFYRTMYVASMFDGGTGGKLHIEEYDSTSLLTLKTPETNYFYCMHPKQSLHARKESLMASFNYYGNLIKMIWNRLLTTY